jgi:putative monooxygenase
MAITIYDQCKPYELDKGVNFRDMQTSATGAGVLSVGTATFEPGRYLPCHRHNCEEVIVILEGDAWVDVAGQRIPMKVYDSSHVPQGVPHRFVNASKTKQLVILWIYSVADVARLVTHYSECMGDFPPEPGEDGYIAVRPGDAAGTPKEQLVSDITAQVMAALRSPGQ